MFRGQVWWRERRRSTAEHDGRRASRDHLLNRATQLTASLERIRVWGEANNRNIACNLNPGLTQEQILELASQQPRPLPAEICGKAGAKDVSYEELLGSAERSIWASTYAFFDGPKAFEVLARRMERTPALRVTLLLNIQRKRGDTTTSVELVRRFATVSGRPIGPGRRVRGYFTTHARLTRKVPVAFYMQRPLSLTMKRYS